MSELLKLSALELARRIRAKEVSPSEVVEAHIQRIEAVNPLLNAVVEKDYERARESVRAAEARLAAARPDEELPPLLGVPCTIKDTYAQRGQRWSAGIHTRRDEIASEDATVVTRLEAAGAIPLGRTNVPEAAMYFSTYNTVYGRTNNPSGLDHIVGGSSGGEGAIIAAGASPFGPGSDVGGSIRFPSFFNGVVGHKPTGGLVPATGHYPLPAGPVARYSTVGPLARRVDDAALLLRLMAGPDGRDESVVERALEDPRGIDLRTVRVCVYTDNGAIAAAPEVCRAVEHAEAALRARGCRVERWRPLGLEKSLWIWLAKLSLYQGEPFKNVLGNGRPIPVYREFAKLLLGRSQHTFPALGLALAEELSKGTSAASNPRMQRLAALGDAMQAEIEAKLGPRGVLVCPPFHRAAPPHRTVHRSFLGVSYSAVFNVLELPATAVPIERTAAGLPVGVQVVGSRFADAVTLAVARALEDDFGGWRLADPLTA